MFQKPYVEIPSLTGLQMQEAADLCWQAFRRRDDSVIIDWFQGQYRSHLTCPDCGGESTAFDPFRCLSLPLPPPRVTFNVYILPVFRLTADGGAESMADAAAGAGSMQPLSLRVGPKETTEAIVAALAEQLHIPTAQLELVLWVNGVVRRTLHQAWPWTPATDGETVPGQAPAQPLLLQSVSRDMRTLRLVAYIYPPASAADPEQWCHLKIDQRLLKLPEVSHCGHYCAAGNEAGTGTTPSTPASAGDTSATSSPAPVSFSAMAAVPPTLKRCSRCRQVAYCSVTCQKADYNQHVNQCKRTGATMPSGVPLRLLCPRASITSAILQQGVAAAGCLPLGERVTATLHEYGSNNVFGVVFKPPERLPPVLSIGVTWWYLPSGDKDTDKENTKQKEEEEETEQEGAAADLALDGIDDLEWDVDEEAVRQVSWE